MKFRQKYTLLPFTTKDGKIIYYVRFFDPRTGRRTKVSSGETTKGRAHTFAENLLGESSAQAPRLEDYARGFFKWGTCPWILRQHAKGHSFSQYQAKTRRAHLDNHILPRFGKKRLSDLTRPVIENWLIGLPLSNQSKNHILYTFRIVLREAKSEKLIRDNPLAEAEPLARNHRRRDVFTMEELKKLFPRTKTKLLEVWKSEKYAALFMTLATTGIRSGEVRALQWRDLLSGGWLHVERACKMDKTIGQTKTGEKRVIALPSRTLTVLAQWHRNSPFTEPQHLIFFGTDAEKPFHVETLTHFLPGALERVGIKTAGRNLVVHSLRHTYNTIMRAVLPEEILRKFTGHKTVEMTSLYDHPAVKDQIKRLEGARSIVENVWALRNVARKT